VSAERHAEAKRLFLAALELPSAARDDFIARSCKEDEELGAEVRSLLSRVADSSVAAEEFEFSEERTAFIGAQAETIRVTNYRVLQKIGEGGMGEVYEAEQKRPIRRRVALKVLKGGLETREVIARFESERQALAMMSHPTIARVFEAGVTERERPYFAMELVHGESITTYCDRHRLTTRARLELFTEVCAGVQHAHQKGIIHRDLKPSNVLVTLEDGRPAPKIIDFGVAKATAQPLTERTLFTELGQWIGTPEYMSPEQAEMSSLDIDTRTDVYSLGVLLYELLVGARPFDMKALRAAGFDEMRRRIREDDPTRPSTKVSDLGDDSSIAAQNRQADVGTLVQQLRGDLDWITMKALDKDRTRRYDSPSEFAADIRRHLADEPVVACPPSVPYKLRKFVRRNRVAVVSASLVAGALLLGLMMTAMALHRAQNEAQRATQVADFLQEIFEDFNPYADRTAVSATKMLDRAVERMETELDGQDLVQARLMSRIGVAYGHLDLFDRGEELLQRSLAIFRSEFGDENPEVIGTLNELSGLSFEAGRYLRAIEYIEESLEIRSRVFDPADPDLASGQSELALFYWARGDYRRAEELLVKALPRLERHYGADHVALTRNLFIQGILFNNTREFERARLTLERALRIRLHELGPSHVRVGWTYRTLARNQLLRGEYELALETGQRALEIMEQTLGLDHSDTAYVRETLGTAHRMLGHFEEAQTLLERALSVRENALGPDHVELGLSLNKLAELHLDLGDPDSAAPLLERALTIDRNRRPERHAVIAWTLHALSRQRLLSGESDEALTLQKQALEIIESSTEPDSPALAAHLAQLGVILRHQGNPEAAEPLLERALALREAQLGPAHIRTADVLRELGVLYSQLAESEKSKTNFERALAMYEEILDADHPAVVNCRRAYAEYVLRVD